jgi:hypothetical protein
MEGHTHPLHDVEGACLLALGHLVVGKDLVVQVGEAQEVEVPLAAQAQVDHAAGQVDRLAAAALSQRPAS